MSTTNRLSFLVIILISVFSGCSAIDDFTRTKVGQSASENIVSGSAGSQGSRGSEVITRCDKPLGTVALREDENNKMVLLQHNLPSDPTPIMKIITHQSGCLMVVDRGAGMDVVMMERELEEKGMLASSGSDQKVRLVRADYTITPNIIFSDQNAGGAGAGASVGSLFGPIGFLAGALAGSMKKMEAQVVLFLIDNRTGLQVASATGQASKTDIAGGLGLFGFGSSAFGGGGLGGWQSTDEGKIVAAAFAHAYNNLIGQMPGYKPKASVAKDEEIAKTH